MSSPNSFKRLENAGLVEGATKKRRKGAARLSCAECRRLKLKCDRSVPCGSCIKRGCGQICPDGSLTTGQGNRFVLASTQELHEHISNLSTRVRELEDALRSSHSQITPERHPLLSDELLRIKAPLQREASSARNATTSAPTEEPPNPDVVDSFGSLSISMTGRAKYFGSFANSWNEFPEEDETDERLTSLQDILPPEVLSRSTSFPIAPDHPSLDLETLRTTNLYWYLPSPEVALNLRDIYYHRASWMYSPISPDAFASEVYAQFYAAQAAPPIADDPLIAHRLALMFMVLAIGTLMDERQTSYGIEAEKYYQLARAALFRDSLFDEPTINAVQALYLMSFYLFLADRHGTGSGSRWAIMGLAVKVAQSVSLQPHYRDSGRWKVEDDETQKRRELFWELFTYDSWQCLTFGRPPSFSLAHVDCKMPHPAEPSDEQSFHAWKHKFTSECMTLVHDQAFGARTPTYTTILQLDRKVRLFPVPPILQIAGFGSSQPRPGGFPESVALTLQRHIVLALREMNLLYLHRSFFARAVSDHPKDPLGSPYGTSVIAAYRSAGSLIALMRNLHAQLKEPSERMWFLWTHMFSCAIVLGSIVTRCPSMSLAPSALVQLDSACELFSKAAPGFRAQKVLAIMLRLQEKAHYSLTEFRNGKSPVSARSAYPPEPLTPDDQDDELSTLGGKTRLVAKKEYTSPSPPAIIDHSPTSMNPVVPLPLPSYDGQQHPVHPSVVEYLRTFGPTPNPERGMPAPSSSPETYPDGTPTMYNFSGVPTQYMSPEAAQYHYQQQEQPMHHEHRHPLPQVNVGPDMVADSEVFPQYFPVYDYGQAVSSNGNVNAYTPMMESIQGQRRESHSPEANMQTTWHDFVAGLTTMN
ncbi:hypothetical protein PLICRDRAFT_56260 [Plicaturopsis crispa FD-325 SS-3]|nr:hypothetical protein PLICRDRAFT_56260 [Plicaturopsis crispa FD-325 SS-3]